ncbi:MAG: LytTR family transcriptional regulator [Clostridia bacterium]|nr:LytTR family transcriptional regulator [Clostridia bacterium]
MKCKIIIDPSREEEILVYAQKTSPLTEAIERLAREEESAWIGYGKESIVPLDPKEVLCFSVEGNKVYAHLEKERLWMKCRLYQLEERLPEEFIKINQSCIANCKKIARFEVSISGALRVVFRNGYSDYVSRRQLKFVKERFGIL